MLNRILDDVKEEQSRQCSARVRGLGKYKEKDVVKNNKGEIYKVEGQINFVTLFRDEN